MISLTTRDAQVQAACRVALEFSRRLHDELGNVRMGLVIERNRTAWAGECHSHDFCDANEVMDKAMEACGIDSGNPDIAETEFHNVWALAWKFAKASEFETTNQ